MNFKKYSVNDSSKVFLWALLLPQVASILVACVFTFIYKTQEELVNSLAYLLVLSLIAQVCFCFIAFYYNKKNKFDFIKISNIKQKINWVNILICVGVALICILGYVNFINLVGYFSNSLPLQSLFSHNYICAYNAHCGPRRAVCHSAFTGYGIALCAYFFLVLDVYALPLYFLLMQI